MKLIDFILAIEAEHNTQMIRDSIKNDAKLWVEEIEPENITPYNIYVDVKDVFLYSEMRTFIKMLDILDISAINLADHSLEIEWLSSAYYYTDDANVDMNACEVWECFLNQYAQEVYDAAMEILEGENE